MKVLLIILLTFFNYGNIISQVIPTDGQIAYYPFNNNANDESGNGHDATYNGASITDDRFGNTQSAYYFDGTSSNYISIPSDPTLSPTNELTISAWVKLTDSNNDQKVIGKATYSPSTGYVLGVQNSKIYPEIYTDDGTRHSTQAGVIPNNEWVHLCITWKTGDRFIGYIDGDEVFNQTASSFNISTTTSQLVIGTVPWGPGSGVQSVDGSIDDIRIYDVALSQSEILTLFNRNKQPSEVTLNFECDMSIEKLYGRFWPEDDYLTVRGNFNDWANVDTMLVSISDTNIYEKSVSLSVFKGDKIDYKFTQSLEVWNGGWVDNWEEGANREYIITNEDISSGNATVRRTFDDLDLNLYKSNIQSFTKQIKTASVYSATGTNWTTIDENYIETIGGWKESNDLGDFARGLNSVGNIHTVLIDAHPDYYNVDAATVADYTIDFPSKLSTSFGLINGQTLGDVNFVIQIFDGVIYTSILDTVITDSDSLKHFEYDLTPWENQQVTVRFITDPHGVTHEDWAVWADPIVEVQLPSVYVDVKIFMEGCYNNLGKMDTLLKDQGLIPLNQPFNNDPWNYSGSENVSSIPENVVDWVLVELRTNIDASNSVAKRAGFIKNDGIVVDLDGISNLKFDNVSAGDYYIVVYHRNHLQVMSAHSVTLSNP